MRQQRRLVVGLDRLGGTLDRGGSIALAEVSEARVLGQSRRQLRADAGAAEAGGRAGVPLHDDGLGGLHRLPGAFCDSRHAAGAAVAARHRQHLQHAGQGQCGLAVKTGYGAAQRGAHHHTGIALAGQQRVQAEAGATVLLAGGLMPVPGPADQGEICRGLQCHLVRQRQLGRRCGQVAKARAAAAGGMRHHPGGHPAVSRRHLPALGSGGHQQGPGTGAGLAHRAPQVLHAG